MSANVGLSTPRGSGTSGYVQRNAAHLRPRDHLQSYSREPDLLKHTQRQPDKQILEHERAREVEVKVFDLRDKLEEEGVDEEEIETQCEALRKKLSQAATASGPSGRSLKKHQVHEMAAAKIQESDRLRRALGISRDYEEGGHWKKQEERLRDSVYRQADIDRPEQEQMAPPLRPRRDDLETEEERQNRDRRRREEDEEDERRMRDMRRQDEEDEEEEEERRAMRKRRQREDDGDTFDRKRERGLRRSLSPRGRSSSRSAHEDFDHRERGYLRGSPSPRYSSRSRSSSRSLGGNEHGRRERNYRRRTPPARYRSSSRSDDDDLERRERAPRRRSPSPRYRSRSRRRSEDDNIDRRERGYRRRSRSPRYRSRSRSPR